MERPVALLDGDGGGLRLLAELTRQLPAEDYVYLADAGRGPYGRAPVAEVRRWTEQGAYFLLRFDPKVLVVASHTMGAVAGETLRKSFPVPVFSPCGLLWREAAERGARVVALVASDTSLASGFYQEALAKAGLKAVLCPASELTEALAEGVLESEGLSAPTIGSPTGHRVSPGPAAPGRRGWPKFGRLRALVQETLAPALAAEPQVEAVLLAESALGLVAPLVQQVMGPEVGSPTVRGASPGPQAAPSAPPIPVISVLAQLAGEVERMLALAGMEGARGPRQVVDLTLRPPGAQGSRYFLASGDVERFRERGAALYGEALGRVVKVSPQRFFEQREALSSPAPGESRGPEAPETRGVRSETPPGGSCAG